MLIEASFGYGRVARHQKKQKRLFCSSKVVLVERSKEMVPLVLFVSHR